MKTIKNIIFVVLLLTSTLAVAQTTIRFSYDDAGNRTKREILLKKSLEANSDSASISEADTELVTDWLDKMKITIYPNPTRGELTIDIANIPQDADGEITIHNTEGKRLHQLKQLNSTNVLDLSAYSTGIYVVRITTGQKSCERKIVKE
jgi:YD repeat-containing protein